MMKTKLLSVPVALLIGGLFFAGCKKDEVPPNEDEVIVLNKNFNHTFVEQHFNSGTIAFYAIADDQAASDQNVLDAQIGDTKIDFGFKGDKIIAPSVFPDLTWNNLNATEFVLLPAETDFTQNDDELTAVYDKVVFDGTFELGPLKAGDKIAVLSKSPAAPEALILIEEVIDNSIEFKVWKK